MSCKNERFQSSIYHIVHISNHGLFDQNESWKNIEPCTEKKFQFDQVWQEKESDLKATKLCLQVM